MSTSPLFAAGLAALALVAPGCGDSAPAATGPKPVTAHGRGVTVELPENWQRAAASLTPELQDPREALSVGTFPLRYRGGACAHLPSSALGDLGPRDAFLTLQERGRNPGASWDGFPPRPERFGPHLGQRSESAACAPGARFTDHWIWFTDAGRHFHLLVAFGRDAPAEVRDQAWRILDSLKVDAAARPDWSSTP